MPRLLKATVLDRWIDAFADWGVDDQEFAIAQVAAIHRQSQRRAVTEKDKPKDDKPSTNGQASLLVDTPFEADKL